MNFLNKPANTLPDSVCRSTVFSTANPAQPVRNFISISLVLIIIGVAACSLSHENATDTRITQPDAIADPPLQQETVESAPAPIAVPPLQQETVESAPAPIAVSPSQPETVESAPAPIAVPLSQQETIESAPGGQQKHTAHPTQLSQQETLKPKKPIIHTRANNYVARGSASWYSIAAHGAKTTSGQIFNLYSMTAAHATLPLLTRVKVKNIRTGDSVVVTINHRLDDERVLIKLSYWAARRIGLDKKPSQHLEVRELSSPRLY